MEKTLLFEALTALTQAEIREFEKFVQSPFFNPKPGVAPLLAYLTQCLQQKTAPEADSAFQAIYPDAPFNDARLRLHNSALLGLLEHYLAYQEKFADLESVKISQAAVYRKRNLPKHFQISLREARKALERRPMRHAVYFEQLQEIEWEQFQFDSASRRAETFNLQESSDLMDAAFLVRKLQLACLAISHQTMFKTEYRIGLLPAVLEAAEQQSAQPAIALYYHCYRFLTDAEPFAHFSQFRTLLFAHAALLPADELRTLHLLAVNFGIKRINQSQDAWLQATLDLYKSALERDLLLENNLLSRFAFNNITAIALRVGELNWAEDFIHRYKPRLERSFREATADLNLARVAYARKDYGKALQHLQRADYKDLMNNLTAKTLQLKIYYETDEFDLLESHLDSMKTFIRRHTAIGYHRTNYSRIVYYTRRLMQLNRFDAAAKAGLKDQLAGEEGLTEKGWFLEMLG
ncbi:MAG: hypothetical protein WCR52_20850 [Bacteroidota bacterium]